MYTLGHNNQDINGGIRMIVTKKLSSGLTSAMIKSNVITHNEKELYTYCFDYIFELVFSILSFLFIGLLFDRFIFSCIFLLVIFPLRTFGGGIHAPTSLSCTIISYLIYVIALIIGPILAPMYSIQWTILLFLEILIIVIFAPVDTPNKRLRKEQRTKLKTFCTISLIVIALIYFVLYCQKLRIYYGTISIYGIIPTTSIILGYIKNKLGG